MHTEKLNWLEPKLGKVIFKSLSDDKEESAKEKAVLEVLCRGFIRDNRSIETMVIRYLSDIKKLLSRKTSFGKLDLYITGNPNPVVDLEVHYNEKHYEYLVFPKIRNIRNYKLMVELEDGEEFVLRSISHDDLNVSKVDDPDYEKYAIYAYSVFLLREYDEYDGDANEAARYIFRKRFFGYGKWQNHVLNIAYEEENNIVREISNKLKKIL